MLLRGAAGTILIASAVAKLAAPARSKAALAPFAPPSRSGPTVLWALVSAVELGLGAAVAAGSTGAAYAAGALVLSFAAALVGEILKGHAGRPCACFGPRG